ncbi:hypothetical protein AB4133_19930 [Vibrio sp. 10N.286.52.F8]|uniref:hypothetical protein n=1 Tax=Vibrio sp. 10N.286.52.F8 TaxID=3229716 RepID=UPI003553D414
MSKFDFDKQMDSMTKPIRNLEKQLNTISKMYQSPIAGLVGQNMPKLTELSLDIDKQFGSLNKILGKPNDHNEDFTFPILYSDTRARNEQVNNTYNFNSNSNMVQIGNGNTQEITITLQQLKEQIEKSSDPKAKSLFKDLVNNPTVASIIGGLTSAI